MNSQLGRSLFAACLAILISTPALAEDPAVSLSNLKGIIETYASIPRSELVGTTIDEREPIILNLQARLADALENVDYDKLSAIEPELQADFASMTKRIEAYINMLQTKESIGLPS